MFALLLELNLYM